MCQDGQGMTEGKRERATTAQKRQKRLATLSVAALLSPSRTEPSAALTPKRAARCMAEPVEDTANLPKGKPQHLFCPFVFDQVEVMGCYPRPPLLQIAT